jgi:hypothetical protein
MGISFAGHRLLFYHQVRRTGEPTSWPLSSVSRPPCQPAQLLEKSARDERRITEDKR